MITLMICIVSVVLLFVFASSFGGGSTSESNTITILSNNFKTASGKPCTKEDWNRQFLHGLRADEEPCKIVGESKEVVAVPVKSEEEKNWEYLCKKLRAKPTSALSQNDWDVVALCKIRGDW